MEDLSQQQLEGAGGTSKSELPHRDASSGPGKKGRSYSRRKKQSRVFLWIVVIEALTRLVHKL